MEIISITAGETVFEIAQRYGLDVQKIISDNGLPPDGALVPGQAIILLFPEVTYTAEQSVRISSLAYENGTDARTLFRNNYFLNGENTLDIGETAVISYQNTENRRPAIIGGYAYPSIPDELLNSVTPYMTYIMPFTYGFTPDGILLPLADDRIIDAARRYGARPLLHLSTLTEGGFFSNELAAAILSNPEGIENLYANLLSTVEEKGYYGVDVDFEFLFADDRERYVSFISGLTELMNQNGYITVVALPPKNSDDQPGLLYEGVDYAGLGEAANYAFLMTYEWGYRFGPPLAVAPINQVRRVVEYALSRIPADKVLFGIPNYGYDWTLPFVQGESEALSISTVEALSLAREFGAEIIFDEEAKSPYFNYTDTNGNEHIVWYEDARSYDEKVALLEEYGLPGAFIWDLMRENPQGFVTLNSLIDIQ